MTTSRKLILGAAIVAAATAYLAYAGATASWQYYVTVDECVDQAPELIGHRLRVHGNVVAGTLDIAASRRSATFRLAGERHDIGVRCECAIPDNLAAGVEVVVEGQFEREDVVLGHKVLTKCASKYSSQGSR